MESPAALPRRDVVEYELLFDCVHCGLCLEACPTYLQTRTEMDSPRGRIYLMKALAERQIDLDADTVRHLDLCLGCRGCETACPSGVHYGRLIEQARGYIERNHRRPLLERMRRRMIGLVFPYPRRMRILLAPLRLAERAGLRPAIRALMPPALRAWIDLLPPLGAPRADGSHDAPISGSGPVVALHRGCVARVLAESANRNSTRALTRAGYRVIEPDVPCCGALDLHSGNTKRAMRFARANVRALAVSGAETVISAASGCTATIAEYGELLKDEPQFAEPARRVSAMVRDLSTLMLERPAPITSEFRCTVTCHDACHLAHGLGVRDAPRELLASIPGVQLIEMAESDLCCGSAGSYNLTEPAMARELARRKVDNIIATGADYVVMSNPGCEFQIAAELRRRGAKTRAIHLADFLALAANS